jgi:hypothetical protein
MSFMLYGDPSNEPKRENVDKLCELLIEVLSGRQLPDTNGQAVRRHPSSCRCCRTWSNSTATCVRVLLGLACGARLPSNRLAHLSLHCAGQERAGQRGAVPAAAEARAGAGGHALLAPRSSGDARAGARACVLANGAVSLTASCARGSYANPDLALVTGAILQEALRHPVRVCRSSAEAALLTRRQRCGRRTGNQ